MPPRKSRAKGTASPVLVDDPATWGGRQQYVVAESHRGQLVAGLWSLIVDDQGNRYAKHRATVTIDAGRLMICASVKGARPYALPFTLWDALPGDHRQGLADIFGDQVRSW